MIEAIAVKAGFNPEGESKNFNFSTESSHSNLYESIRLIRTPYRNKDGYFLRAESFYNVSSEIDKLFEAEDKQGIYGGSLHERSHGEGFLILMYNRLLGKDLYIFDEPESSLSTSSQFKIANMIKVIDLNEISIYNGNALPNTFSFVLAIAQFGEFEQLNFIVVQQPQERQLRFCEMF